MVYNRLFLAVIKKNPMGIGFRIHDFMQFHVSPLKKIPILFLVIMLYFLYQLIFKIKKVEVYIFELLSSSYQKANVYWSKNYF